MKPILFPADATTFTSNGLGALDPTRCVVTEARNGEYELECQLSVDSVHYGDIATNMILAVVPGDGGSVHAQVDRQAFRIYEITEPLNGVVTLSARHISYDLSYNTVMPCSAASITAAFDAIRANAVETCPFTFQTDKTTTANFKVTTPQTIRGVLGGQQGSILDVYGGEYQWNNYIVQLWNHRGTDTNVTLRYGKNITDINQEQNLENVVTGIVPFWASEDTVVTIPQKSVDSIYASSYPFKRTVPVDFSSSWENAPTDAQLIARAQSYITANNIGVPKVSIKVSFVALWQTDEYKDIAPLERVHLCDTVGVVFEKYGINTRAEVIKTEWDCLAERYLSIELGEARSSMASTLVKMDADQTQALEDTKTNLERAIEVATDWLTNSNSHCYIIKDENTDVITDFIFVNGNEPIQTATQIMRINASGLGFSHNGINGPFTNAFVFDSTLGGHLVADFITAGTMLADRIQGGTLESINSTTIGGVTYKNFSLNMTTGLIEALKLSIKSTNFTLTESGVATMTGATINGGSISYTNGKFGVDTGGNMTAQDAFLTNATVSGNVTTTGNNGNATKMDSGGVTFTQNNTETGSITPWLYKDSVGRLSISYKDELRIEYNQDTNGVHMEMDDDSIGLYVNGSPGASEVSLTGGYSPSVSVSADTINLGSGYGTIYLRTDYIYVRDAYGNDNQGWTGTINGVIDGSGNHGDIDVVNGIITNWSGWY